MQKIHIEFDLIVTDKSTKELFDVTEASLQDCIMEALDGEYIENFKMYKIEKEI